jgi:ABC-type transporter Mla MlaB component
MKSRVEDSDNKRILNLYDEFTIQNADEFKTILKESLEAADILTINTEYITEIDLSCLQLLCAVHKSAVYEGKTVTLDHGPSKVVADALLQAGYTRYSGQEECFWTEALNG